MARKTVIPIHLFQCGPCGLDALEEAEEEKERLELEADLLSIWLANAYIDIDLLPEIDSGAMNPPLPEDVREAAREAVEEGR